MTAPVLQLDGVTRRYGDRTAVDAAACAIAQGRVACLLGQSGCGKSSLLRMIAGLEPVDAGTIAIDGRQVAASGRHLPPERRGVGMVFQDLALFPHLDVSANVAFGLRDLSAADRRARVGALLDRFHIPHLANAWPHTLSGGEQQRVAIARAMARAPALLLLDEPFSGLDGQLRAEVRGSVLADLRAAGATVLIVTHDPAEAMVIADDLLLMADGQILQAGSPADCYRRPVSLAAARLLGGAVAIPVTVAAGRADTPFGPMSARDVGDGTALLIVRPEAVRIGADGAAATVTATRFAGAYHAVDVRLGETALTLRTDSVTPPPAPGTRIHLSVERDGACVRPHK